MSEISENSKLWASGFLIGLIVGLAIWGIYSLVTGKIPFPSANVSNTDRDYKPSPLEPKWYSDEKGCTQDVCNEKFPCDITQCDPLITEQRCKNKFRTSCLQYTWTKDPRKKVAGGADGANQLFVCKGNYDGKTYPGFTTSSGENCSLPILVNGNLATTTDFAFLSEAYQSKN